MRFTLGVFVALLAVSPAAAQDMWTGAYVGLNAGAHAGGVSVTDSGSGVPPGPFDYDIRGGIAGVTAGYNVFAGDLMMLGAEASLNYMSVDGQGYIASSTPGHHQDLTLDSGVLIDFTGRIGFGFDNSLLYAKGGIAYFGGQAEQVTTKAEYSSTPTDGFLGLTVGAGIEHFVTDQISLKAEYQHFSFSAQEGYQTSLVDDDVTPAGTLFPNSHKWGIDTIRVGVNWHF
jgi:outer membrane immunogenic protein